MSDMGVVEKGTPGRVSIEDGMSEARDGATTIRDDGMPVQPSRPLHSAILSATSLSR
jgi:hypothetical protein